MFSSTCTTFLPVASYSSSISHLCACFCWSRHCLPAFFLLLYFRIVFDLFVSLLNLNQRGCHVLYILTFCFFFHSEFSFRVHEDERTFWRATSFYCCTPRKKEIYGFRCRMPFRSSMHQLKNTLWILCLCLNLVRWKNHIFFSILVDGRCAIFISVVSFLTHSGFELEEWRKCVEWITCGTTRCTNDWNKNYFMCLKSGEERIQWQEIEACKCSGITIKQKINWFVEVQWTHAQCTFRRSDHSAYERADRMHFYGFAFEWDWRTSRMKDEAKQNK